MKKILELIKGLYNWLNTDGLLYISFTSMGRVIRKVSSA